MPKAAISHDSPVMCCAWSNDGADSPGAATRRQGVGPRDEPGVADGAHDQPIKDIFWVQEMNCVVTSSWDKTVKYWDGKSPTPRAVLQLPERVLHGHAVPVNGRRDRRP